MKRSTEPVWSPEVFTLPPKVRESSPGQRGSQDEGSVLLQHSLGAVQPVDHKLESTHGEEVLSIVHLGESRSPSVQNPQPDSTQQLFENALLQKAQHLLPPSLTSTEF